MVIFSRTTVHGGHFYWSKIRGAIYSNLAWVCPMVCTAFTAPWYITAVFTDGPNRPRILKLA